MEDPETQRIRQRIKALWNNVLSMSKVDGSSVAENRSSWSRGDNMPSETLRDSHARAVTSTLRDHELDYASSPMPGPYQPLFPTPLRSKSPPVRPTSSVSKSLSSSGHSSGAFDHQGSSYSDLVEDGRDDVGGTRAWTGQIRRGPVADSAWESSLTQTAPPSNPLYDALDSTATAERSSYERRWRSSLRLRSPLEGRIHVDSKHSSSNEQLQSSHQSTHLQIDGGATQRANASVDRPEASLSQGKADIRSQSSKTKDQADEQQDDSQPGTSLGWTSDSPESSPAAPDGSSPGLEPARKPKRDAIVEALEKERKELEEAKARLSQLFSSTTERLSKRRASRLAAESSEEFDLAPSHLTSGNDRGPFSSVGGLEESQNAALAEHRSHANDMFASNRPDRDGAASTPTDHRQTGPSTPESLPKSQPIDQAANDVQNTPQRTDFIKSLDSAHPGNKSKTLPDSFPASAAQPSASHIDHDLQPPTSSTHQAEASDHLTTLQSAVGSSDDDDGSANDARAASDDAESQRVIDGVQQRPSVDISIPVAATEDRSGSASPVSSSFESFSGDSDSSISSSASGPVLRSTSADVEGVKGLDHTKPSNEEDTSRGDAEHQHAKISAASTTGDKDRERVLEQLHQAFVEHQHQQIVAGGHDDAGGGVPERSALVLGHGDASSRTDAQSAETVEVSLSQERDEVASTGGAVARQHEASRAFEDASASDAAMANDSGAGWSRGATQRQASDAVAQPDDVSQKAPQQQRDGPVDRTHSPPLSQHAGLRETTPSTADGLAADYVSPANAGTSDAQPRAPIKPYSGPVSSPSRRNIGRNTSKHASTYADNVMAGPVSSRDDTDPLQVSMDDRQQHKASSAVMETAWRRRKSRPKASDHSQPPRDELGGAATATTAVEDKEVAVDVAGDSAARQSLAIRRGLRSRSQGRSAKARPKTADVRADDVLKEADRRISALKNRSDKLSLSPGQHLPTPASLRREVDRSIKKQAKEEKEKSKEEVRAFKRSNSPGRQYSDRPVRVKSSAPRSLDDLRSDPRVAPVYKSAFVGDNHDYERQLFNQEIGSGGLPRSYEADDYSYMEGELLEDSRCADSGRATGAYQAHPPPSSGSGRRRPSHSSRVRSARAATAAEPQRMHWSSSRPRSSQKSAAAGSSRLRPSTSSPAHGLGPRMSKSNKVRLGQDRADKHNKPKAEGDPLALSLTGTAFASATNLP